MTRPAARSSSKVLPKQSTPAERLEGGCTRPLAFTVAQRSSRDVGRRTIRRDYVEIADPPRLGLLVKADDCEREVGGSVWATDPVAKVTRIEATAVAANGSLGMINSSCAATARLCGPNYRSNGLRTGVGARR